MGVEVEGEGLVAGFGGWDVDMVGWLWGGHYGGRSLLNGLIMVGRGRGMMSVLMGT